MSHPRPARALRGPLPILAASVLWGTTGTTSTLAPAGTPRIAIGTAGLLIGGLLLLLTAPAPRATLPGLLTRDNLRALLLGTVAVAGYPLSFYPAVAQAGVAVATVVALGSAPVFTGALLWVAGTRPTGRWLAGTALAIAGCAALVLGGDPRTGGHPGGHALGILLAAVAGLSYATYTVVGGRLIVHGHHPRTVLGTLFGAAGVLVAPVVLAAGGTSLLHPRTALAISYLALVTTFLAYVLFGHGLRHTTAATATTLSLTEPAVAALLGFAVLGERLSATSWWGLATLAAALVLLTLPRRPAWPRRR